MSYNKLTKEKRNRLILVALVTLVALGGIGFGLIRLQYADLRAVAEKSEQSVKKMTRMKETIRRAEEIESELAAASNRLATVEAEMGSGDLYVWGLDLLRRFRAPYKLELPAVNQPVLGETTVLPKFPYKQAIFTLGGSGYYHDFGHFLAEFENQFPHMRIVNLTMDPVSSLISSEKEKLEFKMDVVALVQPNQN